MAELQALITLFGKTPVPVTITDSGIFDANGKVEYIVAEGRDITAQKMAAERIRKANTELARSRKELHTKNLELEDDLKMAREIQITMLPQQYPCFPRTASPEAPVL